LVSHVSVFPIPVEGASRVDSEIYINNTDLI